MGSISSTVTSSQAKNILFQRQDDLSTVKIVDFGLSAKLQIHNPANIKAQCGTLLYMAPEIFNKPSYTKSVDLWSCAVIMFMMFNEGRHPFYCPGMKSDEFKLKLKNQTFPPLPDPLAQNFIQKISKKEYEQRYNVNDALRHPWITRNEADEIPLSIHQSFKGFDSTNSIITMLRVFVTLGKVVAHRRVEIDEYYRFKINDFMHSNEAVRVYSPSRRKMKDKNNELFNKMKQIFNNTQQVPSPTRNNTPASTPNHHIEDTICSSKKPQQSIFHSFLEKEQSFDSLHQKNQVQLLPLKKFNSNNFVQLQKEEILFSLRKKRQNLFEDEYFKQQEKMIINRQKIDSEILQSVNKIKGYSEAISKKQIFQKKSVEGKLPREELKLAKKYSNDDRTGKPQSKRDYNFSLSSRQISSRRAMSPTKTSFNKPMFINTIKNSSYTYRK